MEIEAKFLADDGTIVVLRTLANIGPFQLRHDGIEQQHNIYYDTADGRMRAARYGLRVRHIGTRQIATLKGEATVTDGLYTRGEWEADVPNDDPHTWPTGELRDRVLALLGDAPLAPTVEIRTSREHIYAERDRATFAEISLDSGTMHAGGRAEPFRELEIELVRGGNRGDFDQLLALLRTRFVLTPEPRSKLERALALGSV